jgi:suppressor of fused-like protein
MGLFDIFKKKAHGGSKTPETPAGDAPSALGWDAITRALEAVYPGQTNPVHRAPLVYRMHDLSENAAAFDGISAYDAGDHWHFVTFGLTELYGKENPDLAVSGFGYEFTFKLPKLSKVPPPWAFAFLEAIGKSVWNGAVLGPGHTIKTGPLDGRASTRQTSVIVVRDPSFPEPLDTQNGRVELLLLLGVEDEHRQRVLAAHQANGSESGWESAIVAELREQNPKLVTSIQTQGEWGAA